MEELLISNLETYGVLAVFLWMFIEEILPIPSAVAPMAAAYVIIDTSNPVQAFFMVLGIIAILGSAGSVASSYITYSLGFYGGKPGIQRFGKYVGVNWNQVKRFEKFITGGKEHLYIAGLRAVPFVPLSVISASAGVLRINWKIYGIWSFIGMVPRNLLLGMIGWYLKDDFTEAVAVISQASLIIVVFSGLVLVGAFILWREQLRQKYENSKGFFLG